jgi:transcriptional regulator with XRE-family HTH domain
MTNQKKTDLNLMVGKSIKSLRSQNGWSQQFIADRLNISIPALSKIETGITDVNISRLEQIAHALDVNLINLMSDNKVDPLPLSFYNTLQKRLVERESEIVSLQRKIIELYDEIHHKQAKG